MKQSTKDILPITTFGLLRHGQTEWNVLKKIQGSGDSPLTDQGKKETREWATTLQAYNWDQIIASDLGRVRETVDIINQQLCLPVTFDARLQEQHWGEWEGLTIPCIQQKFKEDLDRRVAMGWNFSAPGGESRLTVKDRVLEAFMESAQKWPGKKILVLCHQGVVKSVLYFVTKRKFIPGEDPRLHHNRLHLINCTGQTFAPTKLNIPRILEP